jgi:hypothetical protein
VARPSSPVLHEDSIGRRDRRLKGWRWPVPRPLADRPPPRPCSRAIERSPGSWSGWSACSRRRVTVQLDAVQAAWLRALADLNNCSRAAVLREALTYLAARESARVSRTRYYRAIALAAATSRWDPISDYLAGRPVSPPDSALDNGCYVKLERRLRPTRPPSDCCVGAGCRGLAQGRAVANGRQR